jgi:hypothetical protein
MNLFDLLDSQPASKPPGGPSLTSPPVRGSAASTLPVGDRPIASASGANGSSKGGFDDLWTTSLASVGGQNNNASQGNNVKKSMLDLDREKTMNSLWNAPSAKLGSASPGQVTNSNAGSSKSVFDDLLG